MQFIHINHKPTQADALLFELRRTLTSAWCITRFRDYFNFKYWLTQFSVGTITGGPQLFAEDLGGEFSVSWAGASSLLEPWGQIIRPWLGDKVNYGIGLALLEPWGQILRSWLGDNVNSGIGLSNRPASLCSLAGRYDNPMPELTLSPQSGTMNLATGLLVQTPGLSVVIKSLIIYCLRINDHVILVTSHFIMLHLSFSRAWWVHGLFMVCAVSLHGMCHGAWSVLGHCMFSSWYVHGLFMVRESTWLVHGLYLVWAWHAQECMVCAWSAHGLFMVCLKGLFMVRESAWWVHSLCMVCA
jgi:hypothetical protein